MGLQNWGGGGQSSIYPYKEGGGGAETFLAMLNGGRTKSVGVVKGKLAHNFRISRLVLIPCLFDMEFISPHQTFIYKYN